MKTNPLISFKALLRYRTFFIVMLGLLVILSLSVGREFVRNASIKKEIADLEMRQEELKAENFSSMDYIDYLSTEQFLEKEAREKFGKARPGETVVVLEPVAESEVEEEKIEELLKLTNTQLWFAYFFNPTLYGEYLSNVEST